MKKTLVLLLITLCLVPLFAQAVTEVKAESDDLRIISLAPNVTEIIYALGAGDQLVGRTDYCNYPEQALAITSIGTLWEPNLETILSLNADIAIASSIVDPSFIDSINKAGITAYQFYEEESLEVTYALIMNVAIAIGREDKGTEIVDSLKKRIDAVSAKTATIYHYFLDSVNLQNHKFTQVTTQTAYSDCRACAWYHQHLTVICAFACPESHVWYYDATNLHAACCIVHASDDTLSNANLLRIVIKCF